MTEDKFWQITGTDMTIKNSNIIFERIQLVIKAYDCDHMKCEICKLEPVCEKKR